MHLNPGEKALSESLRAAQTGKEFVALIDAYRHASLICERAFFRDQYVRSCKLWLQNWRPPGPSPAIELLWMVLVGPAPQGL